MLEGAWYLKALIQVKYEKQKMAEQRLTETTRCLQWQFQEQMII